jgi:hypothetical protein
MLHGLPDLLQTVMRVTGWADMVQIRTLAKGTVVRLHMRLTPAGRHLHVLPDGSESGPQEANQASRRSLR